MACACKSRKAGQPTAVKQVVKKAPSKAPRSSSSTAPKKQIVKRNMRRPISLYHNPTDKGYLIGGYDSYPSIFMSSYFKLSISISSGNESRGRRYS